MIDVSIIIASISLVVSLSTFWLAFLRRGRLAATQPTIIFFGYDFVPKTTPKIFLRTLLYSTAAQGQVIESMYGLLRHAGSERTFSFWGYGETEKLSVGSGLHVSKTGFAANHHFVMSVHEDTYAFEPGDYTVIAFARVVGRKKPVKLCEIGISLNSENAAALAKHEGVLFERRPDGGYEGHVRDRK